MRQFGPLEHREEGKDMKKLLFNLRFFKECGKLGSGITLGGVFGFNVTGLPNLFPPAVKVCSLVNFEMFWRAREVNLFSSQFRDFKLAKICMLVPRDCSLFFDTSNVLKVVNLHVKKKNCDDK